MRQGGFKYGSYGFSGERICKIKERHEVINPENNKDIVSHKSGINNKMWCRS